MTLADGPGGASAPQTPAPGPLPSPTDRRVDWREVMRDIAAGTILRTVLAIVLSVAVASLLIIFTNERVSETLGYLLARPGDFFAAAGRALADAGNAFVRGAIYNFRAPDFATGIKPLVESLRFAGPLIAAGLGIALTFRAGLFNIGGTGQILMAAAFSSFAASQLHLPWVLHLLVAMIFGFFGAALWAGIAGFLKARTGAHEVIVTIMLNYIAISLITFLMRTPILHDMSAGSNPTSIPPDPTAVFPLILGDDYNLRLSFVLCIAAVVVYWWLMERSPLGYRLRMVGLNPDAARTAGIDVQRTAIVAMVLSGLFVGLAGLNQSLGRETSFGPSVDVGIGFAAITVALLGQSRAVGVLFAGLLFGALKAAGPTMQVADVAPDVLNVLQGLIVLFIAAPPLVRAIFRFIPLPRGGAQ
jgi:ABC-type uncharacterized transport system permease subunit